MSDFWSGPSSTSILHVCEQRRLWRGCADAQARLNLRCFSIISLAGSRDSNIVLRIISISFCAAKLDPHVQRSCTRQKLQNVICAQRILSSVYAIVRFDKRAFILSILSQRTKASSILIRLREYAYIPESLMNAHINW